MARIRTVNAMFTLEEHEQFQEAARDLDLSMANIIRILVREFLKTKRLVVE